jgi:D-tyrosyl-tRNA(Tyr) deacylase
MRALVQRVKEARVEVSGTTVGSIEQGLLVFVGVSPADTPETADALAQKVVKLRIFNDDQGKMNLNVTAVEGSVLVVSQFTLYADARRGNRPSYTAAAAPEHATELYEMFCERLRAQGVAVATGQFAADMQVHLLNDGPVTLWLDSEVLFGR